jgi:hypothetical protein
MLNQLIATLHLIKAWLTPLGDPEAGSVTTEYVLWAGAVVVLVGLVVAALTAFVQTHTALIH